MAVRVKVSNDRLQLVFSYQGRRNYLSLGLSDTPVNRHIAKLKAAEIEKDILFERFDGLDKYRSQTQAEEIATPALPQLSLMDLWTRYSEVRRSVCKQSTMASEYQLHQRQIQKCPYGWDEPHKIQQWAIGALSHEVARRFLGALYACCQWGLKSKLIEANPFEGLRLPKIKTQSSDDIFPFTLEERDRIIEAFEKHDRYFYYSNFVKFLFFTGCRPSEAIGLEWSHIKAENIVLCQAVTLNEQGQRRVSAGLKTQSNRAIPLNERLRSVLTDQVSKSPTEFVFCGANGLIVLWANFRKFAWKDILNQLDLEYRKPYNTRHTFATLSLRSGTPVADLAKIMGNSPEIIYKHYAGASRSLSLPEI